jgi:predicted dinucleotide-binding enzyme
MEIAVLGTGGVGETIASKLVALGHSVRMGSRTPDNEKARAWVAKAGPTASQGDFAGAAGFGEIVFNCTSGAASLEALAAAGSSHLAGKILIDLANPLDFSRGMPPSLTVGNTDSLGEQIQRAFPDCRVVKTLNTVNCQVMVDPTRVRGEQDMLLCGNDAGAKARVREILTGWFGWTSVVDLGDITAARGLEAYVTLWVRLWGVLGTPDFGLKIVR